MDPSSTVAILYGSQTGNAEDLAKRVGSRVKSISDMPLLVQPIDDFPLKLLPKLKLAIFICSTTGHGQEPENMKKFFNFIRRRDLPNDCLLNLSFAVYGLGDSSYSKFNHVSKILFNRLKECGSTPIQELVLGDEQHRLGIDGIIYPMLDELYPRLIPAVAQSCPPKIGLRESSYQVLLLPDQSPDLHIKDSLSFIKHEYIAKTSLMLARCTLNKRITSADHFQDTRLLQFDSDSDFSYEPGDVCTIFPTNRDECVDQFIRTLNLDPHQKVALTKRDPNYMISYLYDFVPDGIKVFDLVKYYLDINSVPKRSFFELMSVISDERREQSKLLEFASTEGQEEMYEYCIQPKRSILEVLLDFPSTVRKLRFEYLFDLIPPIKPRSFSIASGPSILPNRMQLIVGVVKYRTRLRKVRLGLCSNYLGQLKQSDRLHDISSEIRFFIQRSMFKLPEDAKKPIIMIGPGLGIAPFKSFMEERIKNGYASVDNTYMYFGCRYKHADFYFHEELESYAKEGLIRLRVAFSRETKKQYVQDLLLEDCKLIRDLVVEQEATVYVAGNSKLPESIREVLSKILVDDGGDTDMSSAGDKVMTQLELKGRILYDCW